ncbi:MAG TPA: nicotinamide-nucleotide amidohydrolase family protein, partial [Flavobacterium sp.]|nr:nicotinamide-nucleotide amidohydrolase family protein [Flavobacterium sp.]
CTGGKIAQLITSVAGSSQYFKGSVVCYHKEVKTNVLGVNRDTIAVHSVVSAQVASEMALGVKKLLQTDYAIAV